MQDLLKGVNVYLIGMMGVGKSTVGKLLAQQLSYRFFDTDILVERVAKKTIKGIFDEEGEESFRKLETQVLGEVATCVRSVIATGGGLVLLPKNWSYLHHGLVVWLDAPIELLSDRLAKDQTRPLLQYTNLVAKLGSILEQRRSFYEEADLRVTIETNQTPLDIVSQIIEKIPSVLKLNP